METRPTLTPTLQDLLGDNPTMLEAILAVFRGNRTLKSIIVAGTPHPVEATTAREGEGRFYVWAFVPATHVYFQATRPPPRMYPHPPPSQHPIHAFI